MFALDFAMEGKKSTGSEMKVVSVIMDWAEIRKIIKHLAEKNNKSPPKKVSILVS